MNKITRIIYYAIAIVMCIGMIPSSLVMASEVKLNKTNLYLAQGASYTLKVKETTKAVKWSSDNKKIATVEDTGKVKAVATGKATITAKVGGTSYKCSLTVVNKLNAKDFVFNVEGKKFDFIKEYSKFEFSYYRVTPNDLWTPEEDMDNSELRIRNIKIGDSISTVKKKFGETKSYVYDERANCLVYQYKKGKDIYFAFFYYETVNNKVTGYMRVKNYFDSSEDNSTEEKIERTLREIPNIAWMG